MREIHVEIRRVANGYTAIPLEGTEPFSAMYRTRIFTTFRDLSEWLYDVLKVKYDE